MANLVPEQYPRVYANGVSDRYAVYALKNVSGSDIADLSADFRTVVVASVITFTSQTQAGCTIPSASDPTTVIIPSGPSHDTGYLQAWGAGV
jgi:hypothetical protein